MTNKYVSSLVTISTVILNEITYTEASTDIVYVTARDVKPRNVVIVTVTGDPVTITTTEDAILTTTTQTIPPYAISACSDQRAYVEACRQHLNVVVATVTLTAPTSFVTEYATVNLAGDSSGSSVSSPVQNIVEAIKIPSSAVAGDSSRSLITSSIQDIVEAIKVTPSSVADNPSGSSVSPPIQNIVVIVTVTASAVGAPPLSSIPSSGIVVEPTSTDGMFVGLL